MAQEKQTIYVVKVAGHPGHGARTIDKDYAEQVKEALQREYRSVRIVKKKQIINRDRKV